jgi:Baseplate J-like protein
MDYTSRDYLALREDLINVLKNRIPEWDASDPSDFGVALVEAMAYMGDVINYYIDRAAAETFLGTASQRKSLLNIASLLGYVPTGRLAATVPVTFTNNGAQEIYLKPGTQITTVIRTGDQNVPLTFEVDWNPADAATGAWNVLPNGLTNTVTCTEGITAKRKVGAAMVPGKILGTSSGFPGQQFTIRDYPIINRSIEITVNGVTFDYVQNLYDAAPADKVFTYRTDDQGVTTVLFGDGVSGTIPSEGAEVIAYYRLGGGTIGNIGRGQTFNITESVYKASDDTATAFIGAITNLTQATGGADEESNEHIRESAFAAFRTRNSAVTKQDFEDLAKSDNRISKAKARGNSFANMLVYVAPISSGVYKNDPAPGYDAYAIVSAELISNQAKFTLAETPPFTSGAVTISGMGTPWDGVYASSSVTGNVVTVSKTNADIAAAPRSGVLDIGELDSFADIRADIETNLASKGVVGTIVHVYPPRYRDVEIDVEYAVNPKFRRSAALLAVKNSLMTWMNYNRVGFNEALRPQEILAQILNTVEEVDYATVTLHDGVGGTSVSLVQAKSDEILRLLEANLNLTAVVGTGIDA